MLARIIDAFIAQAISMVFLLVYLVLLFFVLFATSPEISDGPGLAFGGFFIVMFFVWSAYEALCLRWWGATVGKRTMGLRVVPVGNAAASASVAPGADQPGADQEGLAWFPIMVRSAIWAAPLLLSWGLLIQVLSGLLWLANGLWPLYDRPLRQALHDKAAGTRVIGTG